MKKGNTIAAGIRECMQALWYCFRLSWDASRYYTLLRILCGAVVPVLGIFSAFLGKYLLNLLAGESAASDNYRAFLLLTGCIFFIRIVQNVGSKAEQYIQSMHNNMLNGTLTLMLMERSVNVDLEYFDNTEYYDKLMAAGRDSNSIVQILWNALTFMGAVISFFSIFIVLWMENPLFGILLTIAAVPYAIVSANYTKSLYYLSMEQLNAERKKGYYQGISLDKRYAQDIRLFQNGDYLKDKYRLLWEQVFKKQKKLNRRRTVITVFFSCLTEIVSAGIGIRIGFQIFHGESTIGDYSLYTGLIGQFLAAFYSMAASFTGIYDNKLRITNLKSIFQVKNHVPDQGKRKLQSIDTIAFEHVSFAYPGTDRFVLKDLNFTLKKEEKTVFVGLNGSGKTTLIKLMLRMYDPDKGKIKINGIDLCEYCLKSLRENFSVYFQDMSNYCFTLRENVTLGDRERGDDEKEARKAMEESCCEEILQKSKKGFNSNLTRIFDPEGVEISGGQHQKLALARALYRRNTALILDEPSSNLDPKAEHDIFENLKRLTEGKMTIFTSHRLSNVSLADRIIVLENGRVLEDGSQSQLLKNNERYAELFKYQSEKFNVQEES